MNLTKQLSENSNGRSNVPFAQLLEEYTYIRPQRGQIVQGEILRVEDDVIYIDIGAKRDAQVPHAELADLDENILDQISRGDKVPVFITQTPSNGENLRVSLKKGLQKKDWDAAVEVLADDEIVKCEVAHYNKGGVLVKFGQLEGFVPNSHITELRHLRDMNERQAVKARMVGETMPCKFLEVDQQKNRLVMSEKQAQSAREEKRLLELSIGQATEGIVVHLTDFGAFVDLGGVDGLVHISSLSHERIDHPREVVEVGEKIEVLIEDIDIERQRISLNRRAMLPNPWETFANNHRIGDLVSGVVESMADFGLFINVGGGLVGLAHISELSLFGGAQLEDVYQQGDTVLCRIIDIDIDRGRLSLSLKQVSMQEELDWMAKHGEQPDAEAEAPMDAEPETGDEVVSEGVQENGTLEELEAGADLESNADVEIEAEADSEADAEIEVEVETEETVDVEEDIDAPDVAESETEEAVTA